MDPETKVISHGVTVVHQPPQGNPPPYIPGPAQYPHPQPYPQPQPQPGYIAPGHQIHFTSPGQQVTVSSAVIVTQNLGPRPVPVTCKSCHAEVVTRVEANATTRTHLFALILCLIGCWPCVCVPYCMDDCMNANHYCPNCNSYLGSYMN